MHLHFPFRFPGGMLPGVVALITTLACALSASAHPADEINERDIVRFESDGITIETTISVGAVTLFTIWNDADRDHRGVLNDAARARFGAWLADGLAFTIDGNPVAAVYEPDSLEMPSSLAAFERQSADPSGGLIQARFHAPYAEPGAPHDVTLAVHHYAKTPGGRPPDVYPLGTSNVGVVMQGGSDVNLRVTTAPSVGVPAAVTTPPVRAPQGTQVAALEQIVRSPAHDPRAVLIALALAMAFGALHALTPGHGKTLMAASLVGTQGRARDAVMLGGILTVAHTGGVILLGVAAVVFAGLFAPAIVLIWIEGIGGCAIVGLAIAILRARLRIASAMHHWPTRKTPADAAPLPNRRACTSPSHHCMHSHEHADGTMHAHGWGTHAGHCHSPAQHPSFRSLALIGISGAVPCPDALAVLLVAIAAGQIVAGIGIVFAFSIGLAAVLIALGLLLVHADVADRLRKVGARGDRVAVWVPVASAVVMVIVGCLTVGRAIGALV